MAAQILAFLGYGLALISLVIAYIFWRKNLTFHNMLAKLMQDNELAQKQEKSLQKEIAELAQDSDQKMQKITKLEKENRALLDRMKTAQSEVEKVAAEWETKISSLQNQVEQYKEEALALTSQIAEIDQEKRELRKELAGKEHQIAEKLKKSMDETHEKNREYKNKIRELEKTISKSESEIARLKDLKADVNAEENKQLKKKLNQYLYFYKTIRQQKEMLEERNANWEKALKLLANWIYQEKGSGLSTPTNLGELIGGALSLTRQPQLVVDEPSHDPQSSMDRSNHSVQTFEKASFT